MLGSTVRAEQKLAAKGHPAYDLPVSVDHGSQSPFNVTTVLDFPEPPNPHRHIGTLVAANLAKG